MYVGSFALAPTLTKAAFYKAVKAGRANYRYHLKSTGITMSDIDFKKLSRRQQLYVPDVTIEIHGQNIILIINANTTKP